MAKVKKTTAQDDILKYFEMNPDNWIAGGELQRMVFKNADGTQAIPASIFRRVRELAADGLLEVDYREKGHAFYRFLKSERPKKTAEPEGEKMYRFVVEGEQGGVKYFTVPESKLVLFKTKYPKHTQVLSRQEKLSRNPQPRR